MRAKSGPPERDIEIARLAPPRLFGKKAIAKVHSVTPVELQRADVRNGSGMKGDAGDNFCEFRTSAVPGETRNENMRSERGVIEVRRRAEMSDRVIGCKPD